MHIKQVTMHMKQGGVNQETVVYSGGKLFVRATHCKPTVIHV